MGGDYVRTSAVSAAVNRAPFIQLIVACRYGRRMTLPAPGDGRAAVITGASSGIGEAIARELSHRGYRLVLIARRADQLEALAEELGHGAHPLPADLSQRSDRAALPEQIADLGLTVDILVNNAGLSTLGPVAKAVVEDELNLVEVDVAAVVDLCCRFVPGMVGRVNLNGQEGIVNMLGRAFADNRLMTLFIITLPAIGLAERYGLQEQSAKLIRRFAAATVGRLNIVYQLFRVLTGILGIRLNGHPSFVRPLIYPMSVGAAEAELKASTAEDLPAQTARLIMALLTLLISVAFPI